MKIKIENIVLIVLLLAVGISLDSCKEEDESGEISISLIKGTGYTSSDATVATETVVKIGIEAETEKATDPLIRFNISDAINGGDAQSIYTEDIETAAYDKDFEYTVEGESGDTHELTFTVTNRDGFNKQTTLTLTVE